MVRFGMKKPAQAGFFYVKSPLKLLLQGAFIKRAVLLSSC